MRKILFVFLSLILFVPTAFADDVFDADITNGCATDILGITENVSIEPVFEPQSITCATGQYLPVNTANCETCPAESTCTAGTYAFNETKSQGVVYNEYFAQNKPKGCAENILGVAAAVSFEPVFELKNIQCASGYYLAANSVSCTQCGASYYCPGGTYTFSETDDQGAVACPDGYTYNTDAGKTDITQCQIHCDAGTYVAGYTQLEYIESTGTQYIDTGVDFNSNIGYEFEYQPITTDKFVIQAGTNGQVIAQQGNVWEFRFNGIINRRPNPATIDLGKFVNIKYNIDSRCSVDDATVDISDITLSNGGSIRLFGPNYPSSGRIKFMRIYDNGVVIRDMRPARRNTDGEIGMYDMVTRTFFTNTGTGTFIAGPDVGGMGCVNVGAGYYAAASTVNFGSVGTRTACPAGTYSNIPNAASCTQCSGATYNDTTGASSCTACPAGYTYNTTSGKTSATQCQIHCDAGTYVAVPGIVGYTRLEYIESTGTQYIDTGVNFNSNIGYEFEYQPITTNKFVIQAGTNGQVIAQQGNVWEFRFNGSINRRPNPATIDLGKFVNIKYNIDSRCSVDDATVDISDITLSNGGNIRLFGPNYPSSGRIKFMRIYDNGVVIRDMRPARSNSDGEIGMYDMVTGTFFTNSGTGTFIARPDVGGMGCVNVGAGYYAAAGTVNYGSTGTRNACPAGLTTVGYGHGADSANDCAHTLHIGDYVLYARRDKLTNPSLNIKMSDSEVYYINLSPTNHNLSRLHLQYDGNPYTAYDDSLYYGERDFDTGTQIVQ